MNKNAAKPRILLISSVDPHMGPAKVALDYYKAFVQSGLDVDFLTKYPVEGHPEIKSVYRKPNRVFNKIISFVHKLTGLKRTKPGFFFFYTYEFLPQVPVRRVLSSIEKEYDLVLILFWQGLLSFSTIKGLHDKLHCQIHFMGVDYSQMSGGCHFTRDCKRYTTGCGICPAIYSKRKNDFTSYNIKYREKIYKEVKPVVYGNLYMRNYFYSNSYLLKNARIEPSYDIYDMDEFYPMDKTELRVKYNVPNNKSFIIFIGCQDLNDPRKGMTYLLDSLHSFSNALNKEEREKILLLIAGKSVEELEPKLDFEYIYVGYVPSSQLPELYSLANVYLSPSIDDAGPTMVNQSLCCGTPVVAFEMGSALESIKNKNTGYCAKLRNVEDFARGINKIYSQSMGEMLEMRKDCRTFAVNHFSYMARVNNILDIYKKYIEIS